MIKTLLILSCLLFTISLAQEEEEAAPACLVSYEDYPADPVCETVTDENGEETEECTAIGSAAFAGQLTPDDPTFSATDFSLSLFTWSGDCDCTITYFKDGTASGCYVRRRFNDGENLDGIRTDDILKQRPNSFAVACQF